MRGKRSSPLSVFPLMAQLQDMENEVLSILQQSAQINFGAAPNWNAGLSGNQMPQFPQAMIDYQINRAYQMLMAAFSELELGLYTCQFYSLANSISYPLPPPGINVGMIWDVSNWDIARWAPAQTTPNPPLHRLVKLFYAPQNLMYNLDFEAGIRMVNWKFFQRFTAAGYLDAYSFGTQPELCSVSPDRNSLFFYPGTANTGDTITLQYIPIPTAGTGCPLLEAETDEPIILPDDVQDLIPYYAAGKLLPRARDAAGAAYYMKMFWDGVDRLKQDYFRSSGANRQQFTDAAVDMASSGPYPWASMA